MTGSELIKWITKLIKEDKMYQFYKNKLWIDLKAEVMREQHYECQDCKVNGKIIDGIKQYIIPADTVHHELYVKDYPQYALSKWITFKEKEVRQLTCLCNDCHNRRHERFGYTQIIEKEQLNEERW